jgi:peroxiredoxin
MLDSSVIAFDKIKLSNDQDLLSLTEEGPVLLVFLRRFGCVFCQQALKELNTMREGIEAKGFTLCFVHMASLEEGDDYFSQFGYQSVLHISDPNCKIYADFGLIKGKFNQLFGLQVWLKTFETAIKEKNNLFAKFIGDGFQMPGVFTLYKGKVTDKFVHKLASDRPDYKKLISDNYSA